MPQTPMLPGLGGGTGGTQLVPNNPIPAAKVNPNLAMTAINTPNPNAAQPPTPGQATPPSGTSPTGNTTALPGGVGPVTNQPAPTVTQMLNTSVPATDLATKYGTMANSPDQAAATADKYNAVYDKVKNTPTPTNGGEARAQTQAAVDQHAPETTPNPQAQAMDAYASMNPVVKTLFDNIQKTLDTQATKQSLVDNFKSMDPDPGIATLGADKLALMNINNIMKGTRDEIALEIQKGGGIVTDAQITAMTAARNKTLLLQASQLQDQIALKDDYVKQIMDLTKADQAEVDKQVSEQLGLDEKMIDIQMNLDNAAKDNYFKQLQLQQTQDAAQVGQMDKNLTALGGDYTAFASTIPDGMKAKVESLMGLAPGTLSNPNELAYLTASSLKQQQLAQAGQKIQIQLNNAGSLSDYRAALTDLAGARTVAANANAVNSTIKSLYGTAAANPITAYRTASIWIGNVNAAYAKSNDPSNVNKGPSDLELIDAAVKLNNGGQQVTQVQVDALQQAIGFPGKITVQGGKVTGTSQLLDSGTRTAIRDLATSNLIQKIIAAGEATDNINSTLTSRNLPSNYNLPQIQAAMIPEGFVNQGTAADGQTTVYLMPDGSVVDAAGTNYDSEGNPI